MFLLVFEGRYKHGSPVCFCFSGTRFWGQKQELYNTPENRYNRFQDWDVAYTECVYFFVYYITCLRDILCPATLWVFYNTVHFNFIYVGFHLYESNSVCFAATSASGFKMSQEKPFGPEVKYITDLYTQSLFGQMQTV